MDPKAISGDAMSFDCEESITFKVLTQRVLVEVIAFQIGLEQGAHLSVTGSRLIENKEMELKGSHVNEDR